MADETNGAAGAIGRIFGSFTIHATISALVYSLITFFLTAHFEDASEKLRSDYASASDGQASVMSLLGEAAGHLTEWCLVSFLVSFLASCLFLYQAQMSRPRNPTEGATRKTSWIILFFASLTGLAFLWWKFVSLADVADSLMSGDYQMALGAVFIGTLLAYFLGTLLFVKLTMRPSVPLGNRLPSSPWN